MTDIYMADDDYFRLIDYILHNFMGGMMKGGTIRDELMIALGVKAGIWPESSRSQ